MNQDTGNSNKPPNWTDDELKHHPVGSIIVDDGTVWVCADYAPMAWEKLDSRTELQDVGDLAHVVISDRDPIWRDAENFPVGGFWVSKSKVFVRVDDLLLPWMLLGDASAFNEVQDDAR